MTLKLTIPEFVVALFGLNLNQCKLTITGRIANIQGPAYQVQSLLCDKVKFRYLSRTATLGTETTSGFSLATARFSIDTLIGELAKLDHNRQGFNKEKKTLWARLKKLQSQNDQLKTKIEASEAEKKALLAELKLDLAEKNVWNI